MPRVAGALVTEADLNGIFYPQPGHTPGTDSSQLLDCAQIVSRYKVRIDSYSANRMPSWDQLHDNGIPFGPMGNSDDTLYILDVPNQRIAKVDIATLEVTSLQPSITLDSFSRILAFNDFLVVSTPNGVYFVSGSSGSSQLVANATSSGNSISTMAARVLPITSGISSILWTKASGEAIKSWDLNNFSPNSPSDSGSSRSDLNTSTQTDTITCNVDDFWAVEPNFPNGVYLYTMDITASSPPYSTIRESRPSSVNLICATEKYSSGAGTGATFPYFFYDGGAQTVLASSNGGGSNVSIDLGVDRFSCEFSIEMAPAGTESAWLYINYDKGTGEGRIGRVRGGSTLSPAQPDWLT